MMLLLLLPLPLLMVSVINVRHQHKRYPFSLVGYIRSVWLSFSALVAKEDAFDFHPPKDFVEPTVELL